MNRKIHIGIILLIISSSALTFAHETGITNVTRKSITPGCTCHSETPTAGVMVMINGPDELVVNESAVFTVTITGGPLIRGGTNIAVSAGSLTPGAGMKKTDSELTHNQPKMPAGGTVTFEFTYTAPATIGQQTIYANGNSVNFNGENTGDQWNFAPNKTINIVSSPTGVEDVSPVYTYKLNQNYPNPFNPSTRISYSIAASGNVQVVLYDITGNKIATLVDEFKSAGSYSINFSAGDINGSLPSGIYFYKIITAKFSETKKMVLTK